MTRYLNHATVGIILVFSMTPTQPATAQTQLVKTTVLYREVDGHEILADVRCRIALFRGEWSTSVTPETHDYMVGLLDRNVPEVEIPQAHHHLIVDQPLAFVAALRAVLSDWEHTVPRHGPGSDREG